MRTGCYALFSGYFTGPVGGGGKLTALYYRLEDVAGSLLKLLPNQRLKLAAPAFKGTRMFVDVQSRRRSFL